MEVNHAAVKQTIQKLNNSTQRNFPIGHQPGKKSVLDKKTPQNKQMQGVQRKVQTGTTIRDVEVMTNSQISRRKNELFRRLAAAQLKDLIDKIQQSNQESIYDMAGSGVNDQMSVISQPSPLAPALQDSPFLLLDMRDPIADYSIKESVSFPLRLLKQDKMLPDLIRFKNKADKMVVVYCFDEKEGINAATLLCQKDIDNVFLLTEGIERFANQFPYLIDGTVPLQISMAKAPAQKKVLRGSDKQTSVRRGDLSNLDDKMSVMSLSSRMSWQKR